MRNFHFTHGYTNNPRGIFTRPEDSSIRGLEDLKNKIVAVGENFYFDEYFTLNKPAF
ncbi:MAG: hypothetical protein HRT88_22465, partial [Lentisphaeraceae bacterium]|nr:hypothetical protein [Lentisphaeraceae bacterium]